MSATTTVVAHPAAVRDREASIVKRGRGIDVAVVVVLCAAILFVHPLHAVLSAPLWNDESWVAVSTRFSLARLPAISGSTPLAWVTLMRFVPGRGLQRYRMLPLAFNVGAGAIAYVLVRGLTWRSAFRSRVAGACATGTVCFAPILATRNDLKQYTADAFFGLAILAMASAVEVSPRPWRVGWVGVMVAVALPFSTASLFVGVAAFCGLLVSALVRKGERRIIATFVIAAATAALSLAYLALVVLPHDNRALHQYWKGSYLPRSPWAAVDTAWHRLVAVEHTYAMPALLAIGLLGGGLAVLVRTRRVVLPTAVCVLVIEAFVLGIVHEYPFMEARTSTYLIVPCIVVITIGVVGGVFAIADRSRLGAGIVAGAALVAFAVGSLPHLGDLGIPPEDVRSQTMFVQAHLKPKDVVLLSRNSRFGFAYYWSNSPVTSTVDDNYDTGFRTSVTGIDAVYARDRTFPGIRDALRVALAHAGHGHVVWIVRTHLTPAEDLSWQGAFDRLNLHPTLVAVGREPLLTIQPHPGRSPSADMRTITERRR